MRKYLLGFIAVLVLSGCGYNINQNKLAEINSKCESSGIYSVHVGEKVTGSHKYIVYCKDGTTVRGKLYD